MIGLTPGAAAQTPGAAAAGAAEIIVTAQRREERIQDVPITITAFSNERLDQQNIMTGQDLNGLVPSLQVGAAGQATRGVESYTLRGIRGTYQGGSSVVVYLNEVPLPQGYATSQQGGPGNYIDLENVQALAGPQGTLFGRNTTGGAVLLVPRKPTNEFEGYIEASVGNYDYRGLEGVINVPLVTDKLLVRIAGTYQDRDGFTHDYVWNKDRDDLHYYAGRIGITFRPTERIENYLLAYGSYSNNNGSVYVHKQFNPNYFGGLLNGPIYTTQTQLQEQIGPRGTRLGLDQYDKTETWGVINKTSFELTDELTVHNIASYQRFKHYYLLDEDGTPLQMGDIGTSPYPDFPVQGFTEFGLSYGFELGPTGPRDNQRQITEELQLQGSFLDKRLTFTVGGFYYNQKPYEQLNKTAFVCLAQFNPNGCRPNEQSYGVASKSKALYGQGTLDLGAFSPALESLRLTAGYRYTWDKISGRAREARSRPAGGYLCILNNTVVADPDDCEQRGGGSFKAATWTLGLDYKPSSQILLFGKVSRGYKAGGYNARAVRPETQTFAPEDVTSYEAGFKSDWQLGSVPLRLNASIYKSDYDNIQRSTSDVNQVTGALGSRPLPGKATIKGFEVEGFIRPIAGLQIGGNLSHIDAKLKNIIATVPTVDCNGAVAVGEEIDNSCNPYGVPKWLYSVNASLDLPTPETWGKINLYANYSHFSSTVTVLGDPGAVFNAYGLLNLSLNWKEVAQTNFDLSLFGTNVTNKLYKISTGGLFACCGFESNMYGEPRMYGVRVRYRFGGE